MPSEDLGEEKNVEIAAKWSFYGYMHGSCMKMTVYRLQIAF
jgi:hypothetical protein